MFGNKEVQIPQGYGTGTFSDALASNSMHTIVIIQYQQELIHSSNTMIPHLS